MSEKEKLIDYLISQIQLAKNRNREAREFLLDAHGELVQSEAELVKLQEEVQRRL